MKFSLSVALLAAGASALPTTSPNDNVLTLVKRLAECTPAAVDNLLFGVDMATFQAARAAQNPNQCIWTSDNCSKSPDNPLGFKFEPACQRHDFGYRNSKNQGRFTEAQKDAIDVNFKEDMQTECNKLSAIPKGACNALAVIYFEAVQAFGRKRDEPIELDAPIPGQVVPAVVAESQRVHLDDLEQLDTPIVL